MSKIWVTSDLHLDHSRIIQYCDRPFHTVEEMNETIFSKWNEKVSPEDRVYVVGDFSMTKSKERLLYLSSRLNGEKHLTLGNHDYFLEQDYLDCGWKTVTKGPIELVEYNSLWVLFHFQMVEWNRSHAGSFHLYGHSHIGRQPIPNHDYLSKHFLSERSWNVCVEANEYSPISLLELSKTLNKRNYNPHPKMGNKQG